MTRIKIIFFIYELGSGGAARTMLNIVNNIDRNKYSPVLVTLNYNGDYEAHLQPDVLFVKLSKKRLRSAIIPLAKVIRKERADIVFSTIPNYNTIAILARLLSLTKAKNIVREAAYLGGTKKTDLKLRLYGILYKFASHVIALSEGVKENIVNRYKVAADKITVIYNPVDIDRIQQSVEEGHIAKQHIGLFQRENPVIITAGRLVEDKDHKTLLYAFAKVRKHLNTILVILGEGKLESDLKQLAHKLNVEKSVFFLGFQNNPYVYFKHADVFVLSSRREGFGHVLAEALATGLPVVSTKAKPGAVEVLQNGMYGVLSEVEDSEGLAENIYSILIQSEEQTRNIVEQGKKRVNEFHVDDIIKQYEYVFESTIKRSNIERDRS